jgi:hypothetical protein
MAQLWRTKMARRLGVPVAILLMATTLTGCLGWFTQFSTKEASSLSGISCPSASECIAVGSNSSGNAMVKQTTDAGGQWVSDTNGVTGQGLNAIACAGPEDCVAVGGSPMVLVTTDGGEQWNSTPVSASGLLSVSCPDSQHCWATATRTTTGSEDPGPILVTTDGATSWTNQSWSVPGDYNGATLETASLGTITCPTARECLAVGQASYLHPPPPGGAPTTAAPYFEDYSVLATTNDAGQSWQAQLLPSEFVGGISCMTAEECVVGAAGGTYQVETTDGGATWTVSPQASGSQFASGSITANVAAISCADAHHCTAVDAFTFEDLGVEYATPVEVTSDGGTHWSSEAITPNNATLAAVACVSSSDCWAVGSTFAPGNGSPIGAVITHTVNGGVASPSVSGISPAQGQANGGIPVTVTGAGFNSGVSSVQFGSVAATNFAVVSDSELTVTVPASPRAVPSTGAVVDVTVTTAIGATPVNPSDQFTYLGSASTSGITLSMTIPPSAGAACNNSNPQAPVCTGVTAGDVVTVTGTGFTPGSTASMAECNSDPSQPVILFMGEYIPVSCSRLALSTIPSSGPDMGDFSGTQTFEIGTVGPPGTGLTPTCTEGGIPIPNCTTTGNAVVDAVNQPCPPTTAQAAVGATCVIEVSDTAGDQAVGTFLFGIESSSACTGSQFESSVTTSAARSWRTSPRRC